MGKKLKFTFAVGRCIGGIRLGYHLGNFFLFLPQLDGSSLSQSMHEKFSEIHTNFLFLLLFFAVFFFLFSLFFSSHRHFDTRRNFQPNLIQLCSQIAPHKLTLHIVASTHSTVNLFTSKFASEKSRKTRKLCNLELFSCIHTPNLFSFFSSSRNNTDIGKVPFTASPTMRMCVVL